MYAGMHACLVLADLFGCGEVRNCVLTCTAVMLPGLKLSQELKASCAW